MALQCSGFTFNFRVPPLRWDVLRVSLLELSLELFELLDLELRLLALRWKYEGRSCFKQIFMATLKAANKQFPSGGHFTTWT